MKRRLLTALMFIILPGVAWAQKTCTKISPTSQNCLATVSWTASAVDATHDAPSEYIIQRSDAGGQMTEIGKVAASVTSFQNTFTDSGKANHCWTVMAINAGGSSPPATQVCWVSPAINAAPPNTPGGVTIAAISSSGLRITWDDNNDTESGYTVIGRTAKGNQKFAQLASLPADTTTWDWLGRKRYTSFCVEVAAFNDAGSSPFSEVKCATTSK